VPRFLHISNFYPDYLAEFYRARPLLSTAPYDIQINALLDDHFSSSHVFTRPLKAHGFETLLVLANNPHTQRAWLKENGIPVDESRVCLQAALAQIERFKPEIFYTTDVETFDARFFRAVQTRPPLVAGWRGFPLKAHVDLSCYDMVLSSFDRMFNDAKAHGAQHVERFHPAYPDDCPVGREPRSIAYDVVFSGSVTHEHVMRIKILNLLAELSLDPISSFKLGVFIHRGSLLSPLVQSMNKGAVFGVEMLRTIRNARICVNIDVDSFGAQPPNVRLMEATGAGAFLLTSHHNELPKFFEPGEEIDTFRTPQELVSKISYYLSFPERADAIAKAGQERCLREDSVSVRVPWFAQIMNDALARKTR